MIIRIRFQVQVSPLVPKLPVVFNIGIHLPYCRSKQGERKCKLRGIFEYIRGEGGSTTWITSPRSDPLERIKSDLHVWCEILSLACRGEALRHGNLLREILSTGAMLRPYGSARIYTRRLHRSVAKSQRDLRSSGARRLAPLLRRGSQGFQQPMDIQSGQRLGREATQGLHLGEERAAFPYPQLRRHGVPFR